MLQQVAASGRQSSVVSLKFPKNVTSGNWIDVRVYRTSQQAYAVTDTLGNTFMPYPKRKNRFIAWVPRGGSSIITVCFWDQVKGARIVAGERKNV